MRCSITLLWLLLFIAKSDDQSTKLTNDLNALIKKGTKGVYTGGKGVLVRNPFDGYSDDMSKTVLPATLWVNDIYAISQLYPNGNPMHPMDGAPFDDPWKYAQVGFVVGSLMSNIFPKWNSVQDPNWGYGVFYAYDSNSVDQRCRWKPDFKEYDCPGGFIPWGQSFAPSADAKGSGSYAMGNPDVDDSLGGGTGCHYANAAINQEDGNDGKGNTMVGNQHCECNYGFKSKTDPHGYSLDKNGWDAWVNMFKTNVIPRTSHPGASWNGDLAMCWVNNPRDMINLQNWLFWKRTYWSKEDVPNADYFHLDNYEWTRRYWGWNEIPVSRAIQEPSNWDAVVISVPTFACSGKSWDSLDCLDADKSSNIEYTLDNWVKKGYLKVGPQAASTRPGSSVVMARQSADSQGNFQTQFFCKSWAGSAGGKYIIVYEPSTPQNPNGGCWLDRKHANASSTQTLSASMNPVPVGSIGNNDQTSVTNELNEAIKVGTCYGCYDGGKGIFVRNPFDGYEDKTDWQVVPGTFLTNDIVVPTTVFPTGWNGWEKGNGNPDCPNPESNGFKKLQPCPKDPRTGDTGPWNYCATAYVIQSQMDKVFKDFDNIQQTTWGWGVFYPTDANSVDGRCEWIEEHNGYDCPGGWIDFGKPGFLKDASKKGAGAYPPGNPTLTGGGGGAGCHIGLGGAEMIDQTKSSPPGLNLVQDPHCQCNYVFNDDWSHWVQTWIAHAYNYRSDDGWFAKGKAPAHALDQASCWVNNPRDMIGLQNAIYFHRYDWANQISPQTKWDDTKPPSLRPYWGWNEVPISRETARNELLRDAVMIKLPAAVCGGDGGDDNLSCLTKGAAQNLEGDLDLWVKNGILKVGQQYVTQRPGSYVVLCREWMHTIKGFSGPDNWSRWFFCAPWTSPSGKYKIVFDPPSNTNPTGACYLDAGHVAESEQTSVVV